MNFLITGGCGFIGSHLIRFLMDHTEHTVLNIDKLTYAGDRKSLASYEDNNRYQFVQADICDAETVGAAMDRCNPDVDGLPTAIPNGSSTYGPYQYPEKLIPVVIRNALAGQPVPIYGSEAHIRDWLHVSDRAIYAVATRGTVGATYNVAGNNPQRNMVVVRRICEILDDFVPTDANPQLAPVATNVTSYRDLITLVADRPGHDFRYAMETTRTSNQLDWRPTVEWEPGLIQTVQWYLQHQDWTTRALGKSSSVATAT